MSSRLDSQKGAAFIELAVALPLLVLILAGVGDFTRIFYFSISLTNAARAGAQYGSTNLSNSANAAGMKSTAVAAAPNLGLTTANITTAVTCVCADDTGSSFTDTSPTANNCTVVVATACPTAGTHRILTVTVGATKTFTTVLNVPPIPSSMSLTRTATERVTE